LTYHEPLISVEWSVPSKIFNFS